MEKSTQVVISASRRTDIPAFYMDWFMEQIKQGYFESINPYNRNVTKVPATPDYVHTIVFWSKNFDTFLEGDFGKKLSDKGFNLFFNFTVNSDCAVLEPRVPDLHERLVQIRNLCRQFGAQSVNWRFDPICFYTSAQNEIQDNLHDFSRIAAEASQCGIRRCITSFMDDYPKIRKRAGAMLGFSFVDPPLEQKKKILLLMEKGLAEKSICLYACCEKQVLASLPEESRIKSSSCIPNDFLVEIFGGHLSFNRDTGQRIKDGCGCRVSTDIGSYHLHPCYHNCLFCYANPSSQKPE
ncbi:DUF1848 family protein [Thermodesulfobacteriota bacterium]